MDPNPLDEGGMYVDGMNQYNFIADNPISSTDSSGLMDDSDWKKIDRLSTKLQPLARKHLKELEAALKPLCRVVKISYTVRTEEEQNAIPRKNTSVRGWHSYHVWGLAYDITIWKATDSKKGVNGPLEYVQNGKDIGYTTAGRIGERLGLKWGGRWKKPFDTGHFQYPLSNIGYSSLDQLNAYYLKVIKRRGLEHLTRVQFVNGLHPPKESK